MDKHINNSVLDEFKVQHYTGAFYQNYQDGVVTFRQRDEIHKIYDVTDIVMAVGSAPAADLREKLESLGIEVRTVGDADKVKPGLKNIEEGFFTGLNI